MKKIIAIAFVGMFGVLTLGSCVKTYTCDCTYPGTNSSSSTTVSGKKKDLKAVCENNPSYSTSEVSCKLK